MYNIWGGGFQRHSHQTAIVLKEGKEHRNFSISTSQILVMFKFLLVSL